LEPEISINDIAANLSLLFSLIYKGKQINYGNFKAGFNLISWYLCWQYEIEPPI